MDVYSCDGITDQHLLRSLDAISFLRSFGDSYPKESEQLMAKSHLWCFQPGEEVVNIGDSAGSLMMVISGEVSILTAKNELLGRLTAGEWLGDLTIFELGTRTANVRVEDRPAKLLMVPKNLFQPENDVFGAEAKGAIYRHLYQGIRWKLEQAKQRVRLVDEVAANKLAKVSRIPIADMEPSEWRDALTELSSVLKELNKIQPPSFN